MSSTKVDQLLSASLYVSKIRVLTTLENLENMEISGNLLILENSGKTQGI